MLDAAPGRTRRQRIAITKRTLDALKPPEKDVVLWDRTLRSFGIRLAPTGAVTFLVQYRNAQGRSRRITIGPYGAYTPDKARKEAERLLGEAKAARHGWADARDPAERRQEERRAITFIQLVAEYMEKASQGLILVKRRRKKASTLATDGYRIGHLKSHFGDKPVKNIDRGDCKRCLEALIAGKHGAARTYGLLGGILTYAVDSGYIAANPARSVDKPADGVRVFKLSADGYRVLGKALEAAEARAEDWRGVGAIRLIALGGFRKSEVLKLRLDEIDLAGRCLRYRDTKAGEGEAVPQNVRALGEAALAVLKRLMNRGGRPESPWLLPGRNPRKPYNGLGGAWERIVGDAYTPHCLRHAFSTACAEIGLSELTIEYLTGHAAAKKGTVTRRYIHVDDVLLAAADKISGHIWEAMTGPSLWMSDGNCVDL